MRLVLIGAAVLLLLMLAAFFAAAEAALTAASRARLSQLEQAGDARAALVNRLRDRREALVRAALLGSTLATAAATVLATGVALTMVGPRVGLGAVAAVSVGMTVLILVFGAVLPRAAALRDPDAAALRLAPAMGVATAVLAPPMHLVAAVTAGLLRLLGVRRPSVALAGYADELRGQAGLVADLASDTPTEVREERAMVRSILELPDVQVLEIMTHRRNVVAVDADLPTPEIVRAVLDSPYTRIPLWQEDPDNIVGVLHAKDLLRALQAQGGRSDRVNVRDIAARPWFIPDSTSLLDQLRAFRTRREHFALVVDEYGTLQGVVTLEDILEEIVGEISDEHDLPVAGVRPQPNGSFIIDGTVTLRDLNRQFDWHLPDDQASTVAGLVLYEARRIPVVGQAFTFYGFRFEILRRQRNQITLVRLTPPRADRKAASDAA